MPAKKSSQISAQKKPLATLDPLRQKLKDELQRTILLEEPDRAYWLENLLTIPLPIVENILKTIVPKNQIVDAYVETAMASQTPEQLLQSLKLQVQQIKQQAYRIEEKSESKTEQKTGEDILGQLNNL
jgi:hypothetical protein